MKRINIIKSIFFVGTLVLGVSCTNLDEEVLDGYINDASAGGAINTAALLQSSYEGLRGFQTQGQMFALDEMSTDALVGPTRGGDWDDNAVWRQIHVHTWAPDHNEVKNAWNALLSSAYNCSLVVENGTGSEVTQARFLRALYYYNAIDLFGQVPYREAGSKLTDDPKVWTRTEATDFVISELEAIVSELPARTVNDASVANKDAAHFLLAKLYLNKGVFTATDAAGPYTFAPADMMQLIVLWLRIIGITLNQIIIHRLKSCFLLKMLEVEQEEEYNIIGECQCTTIRLLMDGMVSLQLQNITISLIQMINVSKTLILQ